MVCLLIANNSLACNSHDKRRKSIFEDKTITETTKKELKDYFDKSDLIYKEFKDKKKSLKDPLSDNAKNAITKHYKRIKKNPTSVNK